ncbi:hypothetical protein GY15_31120 [Delftia sp. 670]|nr:hypothetical protein GY15_31120 [Delftia sp. 670]
MGHLDAVSADKTSLGFEFQDLVFIEKLLELKPGESLGLEVLDDIHLETISSKFLLYQVKHSLSGGNITDRDCDLWKTLANWLKALPELPQHGEVGFRIYTNKALNSQTLISLLKAPKKDIEAIITHIRETHHTSLLQTRRKPPRHLPIQSRATPGHWRKHPMSTCAFFSNASSSMRTTAGSSHESTRS